MKAILPTVVSNAPVKRRWLLGLALALVVCASSCCVIPTPEFNSPWARANIKEETPAQFEPGKTTRADVISALGEPDAVSPDEFMLAYHSVKIRGIWFAGGGYNGVGGPITKDLYLVAVFDSHGVLQRLEHSSRWLLMTDPNKMLPAATETKVNLAVRLQQTAYWLKDIDGYKLSPLAEVRLRQKGVEKGEMMGGPGQLLLTDAELQFVVDVDKGQFANTGPTGPALILPFDAIIEVTVEKKLLGRRLVVRTRTGEVHSFEILKDLLVDKGATQSVAEFLQSKSQH